MGFRLKADVSEMQEKEIDVNQAGALCLHAFSDMTHVSPVLFLYLLRECYIHGTCKATRKFQALQQQVLQVLQNNPQPGPATFILQCLYVLPIFGLYSDGFSHLIISALRRFFRTTYKQTCQEDLSRAKSLAARLFLYNVEGYIDYNEKVIVKILDALDVQLTNVDELVCQLRIRNGCDFESGKAFLEHYISKLIESKSYMTAVSLLVHFSISISSEPLLKQMVQNSELQAAEKLATFMGKPSLCVLVEEYAERNMLKNAFTIIKKNNLQPDFPELYHICKKSSLKNLAEKACWDVAETKTNGDRELLEYLVYLAMEAGYGEKVAELCNRYSLEGFANAQEIEIGMPHNHCLRLDELAITDMLWVDEVDELNEAISYLEGCKVVGIDCEWKPNYVKGSKANKVSIMQIASDSKVFILDLIKLSNDAPDILDNQLTRIMQSSRILKLGYNFQCDVKQLVHSYGQLGCFNNYDMLLDIQNVFKESCGGLSGLTEKVLGVGLNKTRRNSNWEQRPLTQNQLEYAALDAAVLIHIYRHACDHSQPANGHDKIEWKSHIISHMDKLKMSKKDRRGKRKPEAGRDRHFE